jgi:hypothetical protein
MNCRQNLDSVGLIAKIVILWGLWAGLRAWEGWAGLPSVTNVPPFQCWVCGAAEATPFQVAPINRVPVAGKTEWLLATVEWGHISILSDGP